MTSSSNGAAGFCDTEPWGIRINRPGTPWLVAGALRLTTLGKPSLVVTVRRSRVHILIAGASELPEITDEAHHFTSGNTVGAVPAAGVHPVAGALFTRSQGRSWVVRRLVAGFQSRRARVTSIRVRASAAILVVGSGIDGHLNQTPLA